MTVDTGKLRYRGMRRLMSYKSMWSSGIYQAMVIGEAMSRYAVFIRGICTPAEGADVALRDREV